MQKGVDKAEAIQVFAKNNGRSTHKVGQLAVTLNREACKNVIFPCGSDCTL